MIIVKNTKELEDIYNLALLPDDEQVRVLGGMAGKSKYKDEKYERRTTYSAMQLRQIIHQMEEIENCIPEEWNKWQRAKYIYKVLGTNISYNLDTASYTTQESSNLKTIMSRKSICAGYSLLFKEMMDRQGIECDYVRGVANLNERGPEKHAWNVLTIDGIKFPVDLTWDSQRLNQGIPNLKYFGNNKSFFQEHSADLDEQVQGLSLLKEEFVNSINTQIENREQNKEDILAQAIEQTYRKYSELYGKQVGQKQVITAIERFVKEEFADSFTRQENSRENIQRTFKKEEMLDILIKRYVAQCEEITSSNSGVLESSLKNTLNRYGKTQAQYALRSYLLNGETRKFYKTK